jgi:hypothetical protein
LNENNDDSHYHHAFSELMVKNLIEVNNTVNILDKQKPTTSTKTQQFDVMLNSKTMLCHVFQSKILNGTSPDFCLVDSRRGVSVFSIIAPIEIKKASDFPMEKLFTHCENILITQSKRSFVIGALTDCSSEIAFLKMTRNSKCNDQFSVYISNYFTLNQPECFEGYLHLIALLNGSIDCGYESAPDIIFESMNVNYLEFLSSLTSSVYKGEFMNKKIDHDYVIKQFNNGEYFEQELEIMKLISNSINQKAKEFVINLVKPPLD